MNRIRKALAPLEPKSSAGITASHSSGSDAANIARTDKAGELDVQEFLNEFDPNLPEKKQEVISSLGYEDVEVNSEPDVGENSPYPEVVASVRNTDEDLPVNTFRAWFLGILFVSLGSGANMLFSMRDPTITITSIVAQLVSYPAGLLMAWGLPKHQFNFFGYHWTLNPGPFNMKEHTLITIMSNVAFANGAAYSTSTLEALIGFYKVDYGWAYALLFTITTQMIGLGLAGVARRFLVYPASMVWPTVLPNCALFYSLHDETPVDPAESGGWRVSRYRWFFYVCVGSFVWYWFPGWIWQSLSVFAFVTWIKPKNVVVNQLFGGFTGLSLIPITFDWTYVTSFVYSPMIPPWHAIANTLIGVFIFTWATSLGIHYSGTWYSAYLPMSTSGSFDNTGASYKVKRIITPEYTLDEAKYKAYSPIFLSTTFALAYGLSFATIIAVLVHTFLNHRKEIWYRFKASRNQEADVHMKLMKKYQEAPDWWFLTVFVVMIALSLVTVLYYPTHLTWWAYFIALLISIIFIVPIGMIQAITNIQIGLNVITELIVSYMLPGRPLAMMSFKTYGYITMLQGVTYAQDMKMGHYMKLPPRSLFFGQAIASLWSCFVQVAVMYWAFGNIKDICTPDQASRFTCPNGRVFFNASIIWGVIGPQRMFSSSGVYGSLQYFWILGALLPIVLYIMARKFPKGPLKFLHAPIILGGTAYIPPATPLIYLSWGFVGFIFQKVIRNRHRAWWTTYNYLTSAALDAGLALCTILIFFALQLPQVTPPQWWGNTVVNSTMDNLGTAVQIVLPKGETFGPKSW